MIKTYLITLISIAVVTQSLEKTKPCLLSTSSLVENKSVNTCRVAYNRDPIHEIFVTEDLKVDGLILKESGLEFLQNNTQLEFNEKFYFKENGQLSSDLSPVELVQSFIRDLKDIPSILAQAQLRSSTSKENGSKPDWTYLPYRMKYLVEEEEKLYQFLKDYYDHYNELHPFPALESYLKDFEESTLRALSLAKFSKVLKHSGKLLHEDPYLYITTHPLLVYRMIRRVAEELSPIILKIVATSKRGSREFASQLHKDVDLNWQINPDRKDLEVMWKSISRMQNGVSLKTEEFVRGTFENVETGFGLNALHALEIGMFYIEAKEFDLGLEWVQLATETLLLCPVARRYPFVKKFLNLCMLLAVEKHNHHWDERHNDEWFPGVYNSKVSLPFNSSSYIRMSQVNAKMAVRNMNLTYWNPALRINFYETCSGKSLQSEKDKASLKCWYEHKTHPCWYINPLKMELLHKHPVLQVHDFIGDILLEKMKTSAKDVLKRSTVVDINDPKNSIVDNTRTSSQTWLFDEKNAYLEPLTERLEFLTGLRISPQNAHEAYQVALYGPSHHYEAHTDPYPDKRKTVETGNRIITIMGYLSDVDVGGRTGFPVLGIYAPPEKGSVVMWYNLMENVEDRDMSTWHGGCPVVLGVKWITNKWVFAWENMFRYKCGLRNRKE